MVLASVEPDWLRTIGDIAGTLLLIELFLVLFVVLAFAVALAYGAWWLREKVVPFLEQYGGQARQVMEMTTQGTDRLVRGVAEFHGRKQSIETMLRVLLFGRSVKNPVHVVPVGSDERGVQPVRGLSPVEGFAPLDLPADPNRSTRDLRSGDITPAPRE
jgi:hypothetical protein